MEQNVSLPDRDLIPVHSAHAYRQLVESLPAAVYMCDSAGRVTLFNQAAVELWGREPELGKDSWCGSWRIYRPDGTPLPIDACPMAVAIREGRAVRGEQIVIERPDGTRRHVLPHPQPLFDEMGLLIGAVNMLVDVTDRVQAEAAFRVGEARLAAIVDCSDDAIVGKTLDGVITSWNRAAERIFGYTADEAIGKHISLIIPEDRLEEEQMVLARLRAGERVEHFETERLAKDGHRINISLTVSPIKDASGRIVGASKVARDVTERIRAEAAFRDADRHKDEFLAMLSHELRNPLNAMLGWMRLLRSGALDTATAEHALAVVERNVDHQNRLIADLLDISRIAAGTLTLEVASLDLVPLVRGVADTMAPFAKAAGITLTARFMDDSLPVRGDAERVRQIVGNLLSNALKFTPRGGLIRIEGAHVDGIARLSVSDTGKGIDREFLPHVFERFTQAEGGKSRTRGLGLGLAIVRQIVELHGGRVRVESAGLGQGATFTVDLPIAAVADGVPVTRGRSSTSTPSRPLHGVRVLVIEDHADSRELITEILRQQGAEVTTADDVRHALMAARRMQPDIVICDIGMPDGDGVALIREIRTWSSDDGGGVPAIALSGYARPEDREHALSAGFQIYLSKPAEPRALIESVARLSHRLRGITSPK
jgi:PAS domain S-box-containing protein